MTASARQRSNGVPHSPKPIADSFPCGGESTTAAVGQRPACSEEQNRGRRPQRLGYQPRSRACCIPGNSPSRITGCRWLCRNHPASAGIFTFRLEYSQPLRCAPQEQNLAALCRNCGGFDFLVEVRGKTGKKFPALSPARATITSTPYKQARRMQGCHEETAASAVE